jgi:hypothetical protein
MVGNLTYCRILSREQGLDGNYVYDVAPNGMTNTLIQRHQDLSSTLTLNVSRKAIIFVERKYTSYMNLPGCFRTPVALPSELIPKSWGRKSSGTK